jgi:hypothetical protein
MERQAGLGRTLHEVIESLTPVEPEPAALAEFDAGEFMKRLDDLLADVRDLRERVHQLSEIVGDNSAAPPKKHKKKHKKKHNGA